MQDGESVGGDAVDFVVLASVVDASDAKTFTVGVFARKVQKVYACEDGKKAAEQGNGVDGVGRVEASEQDK